MLNFHAKTRKLPTTTNYWICTFANNQHDLGELGGDVLETPFALAIKLPDCVGTLLLVDAKCTPMTRVWCVLEAYVACILGEGKRFDVAAMIPKETYRFGKPGEEKYIEP